MKKSDLRQLIRSELLKEDTTSLDNAFNEIQKIYGLIVKINKYSKNEPRVQKAVNILRKAVKESEKILES